ncbi:hypothetical protein BCR35DRAFT_351368 [Leucosporidium creatinivorum]|uniref:Uncharacterized protein n=1 Tax=Leucosporidium creatinivorum TaxID=106004 RepID=A0A1Y2FXS2_9BASI|nr:hypothetical protein BCR35DRAFT_351368 [Leucosporidium creatinivorum]
MLPIRLLRPRRSNLASPFSILLLIFVGVAQAELVLSFLRRETRESRLGLTPLNNLVTLARGEQRTCLEQECEAFTLTAEYCSTSVHETVEECMCSETVVARAQTCSACFAEPGQKAFEVFEKRCKASDEL